MSKSSPLLVIGTVAVDSIETPYGKREKCFGGSASYFSYAASFFTPVTLNAIVGEDFPKEFKEVLEERPIDLSGMEVKKGGKTFHWAGSYEGDMNSARTLDTHLNVLMEYNPKLTGGEKHDFVFLANVDPVLQEQLLEQAIARGLKWSAADTMNFWIHNKLDELKKLLSKISMMVLNETEARDLTGDSNLICAGRKIQKMGPRAVVIKKGEHGAMLFYEDKFFTIPAFPCDKVYDPTGAGDSFAGGMMGYLTKTKDLSFDGFKKAMAYGTVVASFAVEDFSLDRLRELTDEEIEKRYEEFQQMLKF